MNAADKKPVVQDGGISIDRRQIPGACGAWTPTRRNFFSMAVLCAGQLLGLPSRGRATEVPSVHRNLCTQPTTLAALRILQSPASFVWENKPLREGLTELANTYRISVWLDRRIDPSMSVSINFPGAAGSRSVVQAMQRVATAAGAAAGLIENVVYVGPESGVQRAQFAAVRLFDQLGEIDAEHVAQTSDMSWPDIISYQQLMERISTSHAIDLLGQLPHDLLHAGRLNAACSLATQMTLLSAGFDLCVQVDASGRLSIAPLGRQSVWSALYAPNQIMVDRIPPTEITRLRREYPAARHTKNARGWDVTGPTDYHLALLTPPNLRPNPADLARQRWTFQVKNKPVKVVMESLASSIGFKVTWSRDASRQSDKLISFRIADADLDGLLQAVAKASGLKVSRHELQVSIDTQR